MRGMLFSIGKPLLTSEKCRLVTSIGISICEFLSIVWNRSGTDLYLSGLAVVMAEDVGTIATENPPSTFYFAAHIMFRYKCHLFSFQAPGIIFAQFTMLCLRRCSPNRRYIHIAFEICRGSICL